MLLLLLHYCCYTSSATTSSATSTAAGCCWLLLALGRYHGYLVALAAAATDLGTTKGRGQSMRIEQESKEKQITHTEGQMSETYVE
jgi:hypothetical protein